MDVLVVAVIALMRKKNVAIIQLKLQINTCAQFTCKNIILLIKYIEITQYLILLQHLF